MLCSLPSTKSSSSWLDRLHTLKGFNNPNSSISIPNSPIPNPNPSSSNPNSSNPNPNSSNTSPNSSNPSPNPNCSAPTEQMRSFNLVSSILSDLFVMDSPNSTQSETLTLKIGAKRGLRKQANPRICISAKKIRSTRNYSLPNGDKRLKENNNLKVNNKKITKEKKKQKKEMKKKKKKKRVETGLNLNLDSDSDLNSKSFSGTEATVIDTSTPGWKSAKILFRKGSNWKVRDKKRFNAAKKKKKKNFGLISNKSNEEPSSSTSPQNNHILEINEDTLDVPIFPVQTPIIRPKYSKPSVPEAAKSIAMHLKVRTKKKSSPLCKSSPLKEKIKI